MDWFKANDHCKEKGGKLVEIDSEDENTALVEEINRKGYKTRNMNFWIGLTDKRNEGDWRLASNDLKPSFRKWAEGEPRNLLDADCALLRVGPIDSWKDTWAAMDCNQMSISGEIQVSMYALCEFDPPKESSEGTSTKFQSSSQKFPPYNTFDIFREPNNCHRDHSFCSWSSSNHHCSLHLQTAKGKKGGSSQCDQN